MPPGREKCDSDSVHGSTALWKCMMQQCSMATKKKLSIYQMQKMQQTSKQTCEAANLKQLFSHVGANQRPWISDLNKNIRFICIVLDLLGELYLYINHPTPRIQLSVRPSVCPFVPIFYMHHTYMHQDEGS